jgi:hypothetical protein
MGNDWDVSKPINHTKIGDLPQEIRDVKSSTKHVILKEHVTPGTDNAGGQHLLGSTRVYLESTEPVVDPEGNSLATADTTDDGRIAVLTGSVNLLKVYVATAAGPTTGWEDVTVGKVAAAADLDANGNNVINVATGTQSGQAIHVGQMDTAYFQGISTGLIQSRLISTYLAASGQDGIVVLSSRSDVDRVQESGSVVFNTTMTAGATFQDLDLSAIVGANTAWVCLEVSLDGTGHFAAKPKGFGSSYGNHTNNSSTLADNGAGSGAAAFESGGEYRYITIPTDSAGVIQIAASTIGLTVTIKLISFVK